MKERIYLLLGSNQGDRLALLEKARNELARMFLNSDMKSSSVFETAAWGLEDQPSFLNQALSLEISASPKDLLVRIQEVENSLGRQRSLQWGPRSLDIDILFFGSQQIESPELIIPHPRISERRFALAPMAELAPQFRHPINGRSMTELLNQCPDPLPVQLYENVPGQS